MSRLFDWFKKKKDQELLFNLENAPETEFLAGTTLMRWYLYDLDVANPEALANRLELPSISEEGSEKEKQDSDIRMGLVENYEPFVKMMAEISGSVINKIQDEYFETHLRDHFPDVTDEEIVSLREVRAENAEFFDQIGFAAALFTLSVGFHVGLFLPGPVLQTKEQDEL